jgi:glycosyltransferase involved in cell wall biosynthesis
LKVSVIIPFVNEWPSIVFTIRAVREQLEGNIDYEIICIDNYCEEVAKQGIKPDRAHDHYVLNKKILGLYDVNSELKEKATFNVSHISAQAKVNSSWLKYYRYTEKLSHWNAKNLGIKKATGDVFLFLDAHVVPSNLLLRNALEHFGFFLRDYLGEEITMHLPLSYHILENKRLMYKMVYEPEKGSLHYSFTSMINADSAFEVPCMSTCGMIIGRDLMESIGGWPEGMGIYGGGENYINYLLGILGVKKIIYPFGCLHHHGDRREYSYNWTDYHRNRMIATYIFGGHEMVEKYQVAIGNNKATEEMMYQAINLAYIHMENKMKNLDKKMSIEDFVTKWKNIRAIELFTGKRHV